MSAFNFPTGYSKLLRASNDRICYFLDDERRGWHKHHFSYKRRPEIINKLLKVKYQQNENVRIELETGTRTEVKKFNEGQNKY